jgi:hypothetical protein
MDAAVLPDCSPPVLCTKWLLAVPALIGVLDTCPATHSYLLLPLDANAD